MKYFTFDELCHSDTANRLRIDNSPSIPVKENLRRLIDLALDPLRESLGKPIIINSGYRCKALNKAVGGVLTSAHSYGRAADIRCSSQQDVTDLMKLAIKLKIPYDQMIDEFNGITYWLHLGIATEGVAPRGELLKMRGGKYTSIVV